MPDLISLAYLQFYLSQILVGRACNYNKMSSLRIGSSSVDVHCRFGCVDLELAAM